MRNKYIHFDTKFVFLFVLAVKQGKESNSEELEEEERDRSLSRKMKKVDESDIFEQSGRKERKFQQLFKQMAEPVGYSLDMAIELTGSARPRAFGTSVSYGVGDYGRSHRGSLKVEKRLESETEENFVLCVDVDAKLPRPSVVRREEFLRDDISRSSSVKIGFGKSCTDDRKIIINVISSIKVQNN